MSAKFTCQFTLPDDPDDPVSYGYRAWETLLPVVHRVINETGGVVRDVNGNKIGTWKLR